MKKIFIIVIILSLNYSNVYAGTFADFLINLLVGTAQEYAEYYAEEKRLEQLAPKSEYERERMCREQEEKFFKDYAFIDRYCKK